MILKFVEDIDYGRVSNRVAYVLDAARLPPPMPSARWRQDHGFNEAEALASDSDISRVFDKVRQDGCATVSKLV